MRAFSAFVVVVSLASVSFAQAPARMEFEVASIRPVETATNAAAVGVHVDGSHIRIASMTLRDFLAMAYSVKQFQVTGPEWIGTQRFDINATLPPNSIKQLSAMMESLLSDRFQMKVHHDKKEFPVYALVVGKSPLKLTENQTAVEDAKSVTVTGQGNANGVSVNLGGGSSFTLANNKFAATKVTLDQFAGSLERFVDRPIVNMTGLKGSYDIVIDMTPEDYQAMLIRSAVSAGIVLPPQALRLLDTNDGRSMFDSLQQSGLKLDARKEPLDVIVVDSALKTPTEN